MQAPTMRGRSAKSISPAPFSTQPNHDISVTTGRCGPRKSMPNMDRSSIGPLIPHRSSSHKATPTFQPLISNPITTTSTGKLKNDPTKDNPTRRL